MQKQMLIKNTRLLMKHVIILFIILSPSLVYAQNFCEEIVVDSNAPSSLTVANLNAPHHILKVFSEEWSLLFECSDDECFEPQTINNLSEGTYHINVDNYTSDWQPICVFTQDVDVASPTPGNFCEEIVADSNAPSSLTVSNLNAPHHILKVFSQDWSLLFECSDDECIDPQTINNLSEGTYHIIVDCYTSNWQPICVFTQDVNVVGAEEVDFSCAINSYGPYSNPNSNLLSFENFGEEGCSTNGGNEQFTIEFGNQEGNLDLTINADGSFVAINESAPPAIETNAFTTTANGKFLDINFSRDGTNWSQTIDFSFLPQPYSYPLNVTDVINNSLIFEKGDNVHVIGYLLITTSGFTRFLPYSLKLTNTGEFISSNLYRTITPGPFAISQPLPVVDGFVFRVFTGEEISLYKINDAGQFIWETEIVSGDLPSATINDIVVSPDGESIYSIVSRNGVSGIAQIDARTRNSIFDYSFYTFPTNGATIRFGSFVGLEFTANNDAIISYRDSEGGGANSLFHILRASPEGNVLWEKTSTMTSRFAPIGESPCGEALLFASVDPSTQMISIMKTDFEGNPICNEISDDELNLPCDINAAIGNGQLTLSGAGLNADHVIVKLFSPSWSTMYTCADNCNNPIAIALKQDGIHHLSVSLYDSNWNLVCNFLEDISITDYSESTSFRSEPLDSNPEKLINQNLGIRLNNIYPIPASNVVNLEISSLEDNQLVAQLFDSRGTLIKVKTIALIEGNNTYPWNIEDLPSGFYQILFESTNRHLPIRFVKQRL